MKSKEEITQEERTKAITLLYKFGIELNDPDTLLDGLKGILTAALTKRNRELEIEANIKIRELEKEVERLKSRTEIDPEKLNIFGPIDYPKT